MPSIALLDGPQDKAAKSVEVSWPELVKALQTPDYTDCLPCPGKDCKAKQGRAWAPVRYLPGAAKHVDSAIAAITFAVFDLDDPTGNQMATMAGALNGQAYFVHQTHRGNGYRLVMPLDCEVPAASWRDVWAALVSLFKIPADPTCPNESRIYFCPSRPKGSGFETFDGEGVPVDWRKMEIKGSIPHTAQAAIDTFKAAVGKAFNPTDPKNLREGPMDLEELRRAVKSMQRPESRGLLEKILKGQTLAEVGLRDTEINRAVSLLATAPSGKAYPVETIAGLLLGSIRAMDCAPEGLDYWLEIAKEKYLRAVARRLEKDAEKDADKAALLKVLGKGNSLPNADEAWRSGLLWLMNAQGEPGGLRPVGANANTIFQNDKSWKGFIRFNEITREIDIFGGPLMGAPKASMDVEAANWLAQSEYKLYLSSREVGDQMLAVARKNAYDPLRDWLESLVWDGITRTNTFFTDYFGAEGDPVHLEAISRCFLISCVARAMQPGCLVHTVPILIGGQGVGKSRSLKALGDPYFTDSGLDIGTKDSRISIASKWIVEMAELAGVHNVDIDKLKAFISSGTDDFRPPYGRVSESFKRRCVFVGSTNKEEVLSDWTGNRRFWPMRVRGDFKIDVEGVAKIRDQLFAEALVMYRAGKQWHLTDSEAVRAEEQASGFLRSSPRAEQILSWFAMKAPHERPREMSTFEILNVVLGVPSAQITLGLSMEVGKAVKELGFTKHRRRQGEKSVWVFHIPEAIALMPKDAKPVALEIVNQAKAETK